MVFLSSFPPATVDLPVYEALRADLAASGEEALQPEEVKVTSMRSWIGLYSLLRMIRDAKMTEFTREGVMAMLQQAKDVPMLDMFGGENWTPDLNHPGTFQRAGINRWGVYRWDPAGGEPGRRRRELRRVGDDQLGRDRVRVAVRRARALLRRGEMAPIHHARHAVRTDRPDLRAGAPLRPRSASRSGPQRQPRRHG